ncbi:MAG: hypothetical protein H6737_01190 [Alphaproteobacteria bacterium]|nr:hypothetical protein [Alphaproteobacteria bacterium]
MTFSKLAPLALLTLTTLAEAAEVEFEGAYQVRGRYYNSLSLTNLGDAGLPEGTALYAEHRLWLRPRFLLSDRVRLMVDVKGLDNVVWGQQPVYTDTFVNQPGFADGLSAPTSASDETSPLLDFTIWHAWGEVDTDFGRITVGRVPLHWGAGIWQNDGLSLNNEYGDTADRIAFEGLIQDSIFVRAAFDTHAEQFVNQQDDTYALSLAAAYKSERVVGGMQVHYRRTDRAAPANDLNLVTIDGALEAEVGKLSVSAEAIGQFGGGDLEGGLNDVSVTTFGGALDASLNLNPWVIRVQGGYASGDGDDTDNKLRTFTFDRDYNVGIMMFEQPMPTFAQAAPNEINENRNFDGVQLGNAVSNAIYVKPSIRRSLLWGFSAEASVLAARTAALPQRFSNRKGYGTEILGGLIYDGLDHVQLDVRGGVYLPGAYFRNYTVDAFQGFDRPAVGVQATGRLRF